MRCRECDYSLWRLPTRVCPECATPFRPSDYEFVRSSVRFCCLHCGCSYYGTGPRGHLVPDEFDCVGCGRRVHQDEMVLEPTPGVAEPATNPNRVPWVEPGGSRTKAWLRTIAGSMVHPQRLMRGLPMGSSLASAWWFAVLTSFVTSVVRCLPVLCLMVVPFVVPFGSTAVPRSPGAWASVMGLATMAGVLIWLVITVVGLGVWTLACHGLLRLGGATAGGLGRTFQAICYSSGANASSAIPCLGDMGFVWWIVSAILMVKEGQQVRGLRATFAVLGLPVVCMLGLGVLYAVIVAMALGGQTTGPGLGLVRRAEVVVLSEHVRGYAGDHGGRGPSHALALVPARGLGTGSFIATGWNTSQPLVSLGDLTLDEFRQLGPNRQRRAAQRAIDALPENIIAHRVGDFVFTSEGIDFGGGDPGLWIVILVPDPVANPTAGAASNWSCGRLDGSVVTIPAGSTSTALREQNALRASEGLPPLPDPVTITHDKPAIGLGSAEPSADSGGE